MNKEIEPTSENSKILTEFLQTKINSEMKIKYPTAESIVEDLL